ncbi:TRAP transporter small permease subunit [Desulfitibacter alkalitolerans]|uniref:TRAP transporter small permease subunit n=1 Tax=Desulfitibacter alkalitolerans TaxID=264641 RepID=UPI000480CAF3|nr:TRAP transporter small permease subunit [Desulfitibacter alkalitolerans]
MKSILHIVDLINEWLGRLMAVVVVAAVFIITYGVVMRYVFKNPIPVVFELTIYPLAAVYALSAGYALLHNAHVNVEAVTQRLSPKNRQILAIITFPVFVLFCLALMWGGYQWAWKSYLMNETTGSAWGLTLYPFKFALPIGATLLLLQGIVKLIRDMHLLTQDPKGNGQEGER